MSAQTKGDTSTIHIWHRCHGCGANPIVGRRFSCHTCSSGPDNDLCGICYGAFDRGLLRHPVNGAPDHSHTHMFRPHEGKPERSYNSWLAVPASSEAAPSVPAGRVVRPEFCCGSVSFFGSHAFLAGAEPSHGFVLLTAFHVMDELVKEKGFDCSHDNGLYTGDDVAPLVRKVNLYDIFAANWMTAWIGSVGPMISLPNARIGNEEPYSTRDIAAFHADQLHTNSFFRLSVNAPLIGDMAWLVANSGHPLQRRSHAMVTVESTEITLIFRHIDSVGRGYTSGAPIVNREGHVVGIYCGSGNWRGFRFGHANSVASIRRHLACARY